MKLRAVPSTQVRIIDAFWAPRLKTNREVTLFHQFEQLTKTGRIANLLRAGGKQGGDFEGYRFNDSDVYKWLEASAYTLATHPSPELQTLVEQVIAAIEVAQQPDGYLNSYFTVRHPEQRWTNLSMNHELYCSGHLIEAAVAHYEATGSRRLLDVAIRNADHIDGIFGPGKRVGYCGHPEIELALFKLASVTGQDRYRRLAQFFIDARGTRPSPFEAELRAEDAPRNIVDWAGLWFKGDQYDGSYTQDHLPVREQSEVVGHAVRALYLYCGMADLYAWTKDESLLAALHRLWSNLTTKRMYITGGVGPSASNEGFTKDYDLPNETAYAETCAAIALILWAHRMWLLEGKGEYADVMELALYNGFLSGVSLDGTRYFYVNPLASDGSRHRQEWFDCACCPPNIARLLASLGSYVCAANDDELWIALPVGSVITTQVAGQLVRLHIETDYPWSGRISFRVETERSAEFTVRVRIPSWVSDQQSFDFAGWEIADGYASLRRDWSWNPRAELDLGMKPEPVYAHPRVRADVGRIAFRMGPVVYCAEGVDNLSKGRSEERGNGDAPTSLCFLAVGASPEFDHEPALLGGVNVLKVTGIRIPERDWHDKLYRPSVPQGLTSVLELVPYCVWGNRDPGEMEVWLPRF